MPDKRKELGDYGENLALDYLKAKGWRLIGRKIRLFCGEIDILMAEGKTLVLVEVKTKTDLSFGLPQEMVNYRKQRKLRQLGRALCQKFPNHTIRIDVVAVDEGKNLIEHIVNAVEEK